MTTDPLAPLAELAGVAAAADAARDALSAVHRHPANLRGWTSTATEASWRAGRMSAAIDGGSVELRRDGDFDDPILAGAMRVAQALDGGVSTSGVVSASGGNLASAGSLTETVGVWSRAPLQVLARLHVLAAADSGAELEALGRPRQTPEVGQRLDLLAQLITGGTRVAAPILAAVVHGEILALSAFGDASGVVARASSRLVGAATGLDPHSLGVPEVFWFRHRGRYVELVESFATGDSDAVAEWIIFCCQALEAGAGEAKSIADAARAG